MVRTVKQKYFTNLIKGLTDNFTKKEESVQALELLNLQKDSITIGKDTIISQHVGRDVVLTHITEKRIMAVCITSKKDIHLLTKEILAV